jgi:putative ABC transport system permease protein
MLTYLSHSLRSLLKTPGFTLIAIITIALGVGANTAMFSVLNENLLRPLPFPQSEQLDRIFRATPQNQEGGFAPADYLDLQPEMNGYGAIAAYTPVAMSLAEPGQPADLISAFRVSANFFATFGVQPQLGRDFRADEVLLGKHRVLIISDRCWQNRFGGDAKIIGRTVRVDGESHEIVGVMPAAFHDWRYGVSTAELYRPLGFSPQETSDRSATGLKLFGRRSSILSRAAADGFITSFGARLAADFPAANAGSTWRIVPLKDFLTDAGTKIAYGMLIGLSGFVLLIACSNLANFLLARTMARAREFAVRSALGASRFQLLLPLVVESLLLALAGGILAVLVAMWATDWLSGRSMGDSGDFVPFPLNWVVLSWAFVASLFTALAFGLAPALFALRLDVNSTLKSGARGSTGGRGQQRLGRVLIIGQFALAMTLLAGAALYARGLHEVNTRRYGWISDHLVTGTILLPTAKYSGATEITAFQRLAVERLQSLPGVESASVATSMPFFGLSATRRYLAEGQDKPERGREPVAAFNGVSPRYFETVGTRLLQGRAFHDTDTLTSAKVFVINQAMATSLFGNVSPLGRRLAQAGGATLAWGEIVGVVDDVKSVVPEASPVVFQLYQPMAQEPQPAYDIAVRAAGLAPSTLANNIRTAMTALDPDLPVKLLRPAEVTVARANYQLAVLRDMLSAFAVLGLALAVLGIYGVITRTVAQRTNEFGIRLALGAQSIDIIRSVLLSGLKLALIGSGIGLLGAFSISRLLAFITPGMNTASSPIVIGVALLLIAIALLATWLPARRAARTDPMVALRAE